MGFENLQSVNYRIKEREDQTDVRGAVEQADHLACKGLVISCDPAVGRSARLYTRSAVGWCQALVDASDWGAQGVILEEVQEELFF